MARKGTLACVPKLPSGGRPKLEDVELINVIFSIVERDKESCIFYVIEIRGRPRITFAH